MSNKIRLVASFNTSSPLTSNSGSELHHRPTAAGKTGKTNKICPKDDNELNDNDTDDKTDSQRNTNLAANFAQNPISMVDGSRLYPPGLNASAPSIANHSETSSPSGYRGHVRRESVDDVPRIWGFPLKYVS